MDTLSETFTSKNKSESKVLPPSVTLPLTSAVDPVQISKPKQRQARVLLKEATALKKEKKYTEACDKLKEAYSADDAEELMIKELLRLPMYLQLANKNDEGWRLLSEMNIKFVDAISQADIANQMRVFLQKEKKYSQALLHAVWCICKRIESDRDVLQESVQMADDVDGELAELCAENSDLKKLFDDFDEGREVFGHTPKGNPIRDSSYNMLIERIEDATTAKGVSTAILPLLKKLRKTDELDKLSTLISAYLQSSKKYDIFEVRTIIQANLMEGEE